MEETSREVQSSRRPEFVFRGNAVAAGGFLTKLDGVPVQPNPEVITVHGESSLPVIGGVSHSIVQPKLPFPDFMRYGRCETFIEGIGNGDVKTTTLRTSVDDVSVTTRPTPDDHVPNIRSISFEARRLSLRAQSIHPQKGPPQFEIIGEPETAAMSLVLTPITGEPTTVPLRLEFDPKLIVRGTMEDLDREFLENAEFFNFHAPRLRALEGLIFGKSRLPRTVHGHVVFSIVRTIYRGDIAIRSNVLQEPGFGTIVFGTVLADEFSRRISLVRIQMGSDPNGAAAFASIDTNGVWN